jgi:Protein kinase domain/PknH-like extracellular domain
MPLASGQTFAGYTIIRLLGSGGMGEVYLAQHPRLPRRDALKLLPPEWSADADYRARFNREADLASTLWHPHIVGVHDRGEEDGQLWISMDFVDGLDAARLLANRYPAGMPIEEVARMVTGVASALDYAHKQGLLHRDVKPANIMLTHLDDDGEQRILLTDFGIARNINDISGLTTTNMTVGTVAYSAPEQLLGDEIDGRADQYALAATAYHLLTGSQLFPHSNPAVVISRHLNHQPPALADTRSELAKLDAVLAAALAKRPEDRFQRCSDFARALSEQIDSDGAPTTSAATASAQTATPAVDASAGPSRRRTVSVAAFIAVLLVASISAVVFLLRPSQHDPAANSTTSTAAPAAPPVTFEGMRDFVTSYYADLPAHPTDAWAKLDAHCQNQTGQSQFLDFWASIQSVTVVSVSPRDATSVVAQLKYVRQNGTSDSENRWLKLALVNGAMLLDESDRAGSVSGSPTSPPPSPVAASFPASAIDSIMLTPAQIRSATGGVFHGVGAGQDMVVASSSYGMSDSASQVRPPECVGVIYGAEHAVYGGSGFQEIRDQTLDPSSYTAGVQVEQTAIVFPAPNQAQALMASQTKQWQTCTNLPSSVPGMTGLQMGQRHGEGGYAFTLSSVSVGPDMVTLKMAGYDNENGGRPACQQALGIRANVLVKVRACQDIDSGGLIFQDTSAAGDYGQLLAQAMLQRVTA